LLKGFNYGCLGQFMDDFRRQLEEVKRAFRESVAEGIREGVEGVLQEMRGIIEVLEEVSLMIDKYSKTLRNHFSLLEVHLNALKEHTDTMRAVSAAVAGYTDAVREVNASLGELKALVQRLGEAVQRQEEKLRVLEGAVSPGHLGDEVRRLALDLCKALGGKAEETGAGLALCRIGGVAHLIYATAVATVEHVEALRDIDAGEAKKVLVALTAHRDAVEAAKALGIEVAAGSVSP